MKVIILPEAISFFRDLMDILYQKSYFGFQESANRYVIDLMTDIRTHLPFRRHKPAPPHFDRHGKNMFYAAFPKNKQTTWYAFFTKYRHRGDTFFLVRYIANSHSVAQYL